MAPTKTTACRSSATRRSNRLHGSPSFRLGIHGFMPGAGRSLHEAHAPASERKTDQSPFGNFPSGLSERRVEKCRGLPLTGFRDHRRETPVRTRRLFPLPSWRRARVMAVCSTSTGSSCCSVPTACPAAGSGGPGCTAPFAARSGWSASPTHRSCGLFARLASTWCRSPERAAKISAALKGHKLAPHVKRALLKANKGRKVSAKTRA